MIQLSIHVKKWGSIFDWAALTLRESPLLQKVVLNAKKKLCLPACVAEFSKALFSGVNSPAALSALCHWGFDSCASFELERWREFILKAK